MSESVHVRSFAFVRSRLFALTLSLAPSLSFSLLLSVSVPLISLSVCLSLHSRLSFFSHIHVTSAFVPLVSLVSLSLRITVCHSSLYSLYSLSLLHPCLYNPSSNRILNPHHNHTSESERERALTDMETASCWRTQILVFTN